MIHQTDNRDNIKARDILCENVLNYFRVDAAKGSMGEYIAQGEEGEGDILFATARVGSSVSNGSPLASYVRLLPILVHNRGSELRIQASPDTVQVVYGQTFCGDNYVPKDDIVLEIKFFEPKNAGKVSRELVDEGERLGRNVLAAYVLGWAECKQKEYGIHPDDEIGRAIGTFVRDTVKPTERDIIAGYRQLFGKDYMRKEVI